MSSTPEISVIIVSYNFEKYLDRCIQSILAQTLPPGEIIICDDASPDGSWQVIEKYRRAHPGLIRTIRQQRNVGPQENFISAYNLISGKWMSVLDGDDFWMPDKLEKEWDALQKNPGARVAYSNVVIVDEEGREKERWLKPGEKAPEGDVFIPVFAKRFFRGRRSVFRNELISREVYDAFRHDPDIPVHPDWDLKIRVTAEYPVVYSGNAGVAYRVHGGGIHKTRMDQMYRSARMVAEKNMPLLRNRSITDTTFILDGLNDLLNHLAAQNGRAHEPLTRRHVFPGAVLVNSLPKAGTNLLTKALRLMPGLNESMLHLGHSTIEGEATVRGIPVGVDMPRILATETFTQALRELAKNDFASAHLPYSDEAARRVRELGMPMLLMLRHPADVAVSHARYIADTPEHPLHEFYQGMDEEQRILTSITGSSDGPVTLLSLEERLRSLRNWLQEPNALPVRFEELVGAAGGGDDTRQENILRRIARHTGVALSDSDIQHLKQNLFGGTGTFFRGTIGGAREAFTDTHWQAYRKTDPSLLKELGYPMENNIKQAAGRKSGNGDTAPYDGKNLIFLISQPRAGSTLLQRILAGHPRVHTVAEPWIMLHPLYALKEQGWQAEYSAADARIGLEDFMDNLPAGREDYLDGLRAMAGIWYGRALSATGKDIFLDKTPRYYHILPELSELFPGARRIILLRNPLAVLASVLKTWVKRDWNRLALHRHDLMTAPFVLARCLKENSGGYIPVRYEELVADGEGRLKKLCADLNISYDANMLDYGQRPAPRGRMGDPTGVARHKAPTTESMDKWRETLSDPLYQRLALHYLEALGPETLATLGYDYADLRRQVMSLSGDAGRIDEGESARMLGALGLENISVPPPAEEAVSESTGPDGKTEYLVSAIVSTYNSEKFIAGCLQGLVEQTLYQKGQLEIIVIDANSPQNEKAIVEDFQKKHAHIRYLRTATRETVYEAWNRGVKMARGVYLTNANTDDRLRSDAIEKLAGLMEENPDKVLAYGNSLVTTVANETFANNSSDGSQDLIWPDFDRRTMHSWCYIGPHPVWRKSLHDDIGYFDTSLKSAADWEFWLRAALKYDFIHLNEFIGLYYLSDETVSRRGDTPIIEAQMVRQRYKETYAAVCGEYILPREKTITRPGENTILYVVHNFPPFWYGGTENYVLSLVKSLQDKGQNIHVLFPHTDNYQAAPELRFKEHQGIKTIQMWYDPQIYNYFLDSGGQSLYNMLEEFLNANHYHYAHIHHVQGIPFALGALLQQLNLPYSVTLHDFTLMCLRNHLFHYGDQQVCDGPDREKCASCFFKAYNSSPRGNQLQLVLEALPERAKRAREILAGASFISAPSRFVQQIFEEQGWALPGTIHVRPLGMPPLKALPKQQKKKQKLVFAFLGNLNYLKNSGMLLNVFHKLKGNVRLEIWGNGSNEEVGKVREYCRLEKRTHYAGPYNPQQLPEILSHVDVVVLPSRMESYSMVVREALMLNTPVAAGAVGGILDVIRDGENGWLFDPDDENQLRRLLQKLIDQPDLVYKASRAVSEVMTLNEDAAFWMAHYRQQGTGSATQSQPTARPAKENSLPVITVLSTEQSNRACPYIRLHAPLRRMQEEGLVKYHQVNMDNITDLQNLLGETDILVVQRNMPGHLPLSQIRPLLSQHNVKLIYEFDDAFWSIPEGHLAYDFYQNMTPRLEEYLSHADMVTVSTSYIERYCRAFNQNIRVIPNVLDERLWPEKAPKEPSDKIRILFAGTPTHHDDLRVALKGLLKILKEYRDTVELVLWGNELPELTELPNVVRGPQFTPNYIDYARQLQSLDIDFALVPLKETPFNKAKSHIKWLEYSACGIPAAYSDVAAYKEVIRDKQNGLLVKNTNNAWYRALKWMMENAAQRQEMARTARREVFEHHSLEGNWRFWAEAYFTLLDKPLPETDRKEEKREALQIEVTEGAGLQNSPVSADAAFAGDVEIVLVREKGSSAEESARPEVSILIPVLNKLDYTKKCLEALRENTKDIAYEIIVVDNGSTDGSGAFLKEQAAGDPRLKVIHNKHNVGFSRANNQALAEARGKYVLFLNNDTEPAAHWLDAMLAIVRNDRTVGAVGAKLLYPDGTIQHAGVAIVDDRKVGDPLLARHILAGRPKDFPQANVMVEFQAVTAACLLMPADLARELKGFDEGYYNGYEDVDLCFRIREKGYKVVYQPHAELIHHESKSGAERFKKVAENIRRLHQRWLGRVAHDFRLEENGEAVQLNGPIRLYTPPGQETAPPADDRPLASIVMLTFNALEMTRQTIASIEAHTSYPYELILVDNASSDGTVDYLKELEKSRSNVKVIFNKENRGFSAGNNQGVRAAAGHYICLLNNDVLVADGWLEDLIEAFDRDEKIGMVSAVTNSASGLQVLKDVPYTDNEGFYNFAGQWRQLHKGQVTPRRRLAGFVLLTNREIYNAIDGFDEIYGLGNFEDDDISLKIRAAGYALMVHDGTFIHHFGHSSFKANNIDLLASLKENEKIFRRKWPDVDYDELLEIKNPLHQLHPQMIEQASRALEKGDIGEATRLYGEVLAANPLSGEALLGLSFCYLYGGNLDEAGRVLLRARMHFPENAIVRNQLGMIYAQKGEWNHAVNSFESAVKADPEYPEARHNLSQALISLGDYERGVRVISDWLTAHPEDVVALMIMARVNLEVDRTDEARVYLQQIREVDPDNEEASEILRKLDGPENQEKDEADHLLQQAFDLLNNFDESRAESLFQQSAGLNPSPEAMFGEVLCAIRKEQHLRAMMQLNKLIEQWPEYAPAHNQMGILNFQDGMIDQALKYFARAIEADPQYVEAQRNYGVALIESGDYENGIGVFNKILSQHPDDVESLLIIGGFYAEVERWTQAENFYKRVLDIEADNVSARNMLEEIKQHTSVPTP